MPDDKILRQLGAEIKRIILSDAAPGEYVAIPRSLEDGTGVLALLEMLYGNAGQAETVRAMGMLDDVTGEYSRFLIEAGRALNLTKAQLKALRQ